MQAEAKERADNLDTEIAGRRSELLDGLHAERDDLQVAVGQLRGFEASFRANLAEELRRHIAAVESGTAQPYEVPALADPSAVAQAEQRSADAGDTADGRKRPRVTVPGTTAADDTTDTRPRAASRCSRTTTRPTTRTPGDQRDASAGRAAGRPALTAARTMSRPVDLGRAVLVRCDEPPADRRSDENANQVRIRWGR